MSDKDKQPDRMEIVKGGALLALALTTITKLGDLVEHAVNNSEVLVTYDYLCLMAAVPATIVAGLVYLGHKK